MEVLDKLKEGTTQFLKWIWDGLKDHISHLITDTIGSVFKEIFGTLKDVVLAPVHTIQHVVSSFYSTVSTYTSFLPAPLQILVMISLAGAVSMGIVWIAKRLYELL